ncbi:CRISPR-associated endoribonuclease Cas6 [Clostridium sp. 19966]|uniref:CRISPR-associated endoribonuclease Cas6 n=1 Tax=Clostridium sp. 19966 TaxID=2768166 RepID=UPI0028DFD32C|nr:CRISPR-associated endoribonuclease Cas6 [Clostridium sp. 19966]MDT8719416.1 CRISPR-associated endoribonuclease Cas6 [Clostridium sp. 19966]
MKVYELKLKVYACRDIKSEDSLSCVSELIDKSFLKNPRFVKFHEENKYKNYVHNSLYPIEESKLYKAGNIYAVIIRTVEEELAEHFQKVLVNEYTEALKALTIEKKLIPQRYIEKIYSLTPAIAKFQGGYWRGVENLESFEKRLRENLIKKYNSYFNTKLKEDFELFTFTKFDNPMPIVCKYKNIKLLGDKLTLSVAENETAQQLAYFALGSGILEMNSRGFGYVNFKWL